MLLDDLRQFVLESQDEFDSLPEGVTVSEQDDGFYVSGHWMVYREDPLGMGHFDEIDTNSDGMEIPERHSGIVKDGDLYTQLQAVFEECTSRLNVPDSAEITARSLSSRDNDEGAFYTAEDAPFRFLSLVNVESRSIPDDTDELFDQVVNEVRTLDPDVERDQFLSLESVFSDRHPCHVVKVDADIETPLPHRYYQGVDSVGDYIDAVSDSQAGQAALESQETYSVYTVAHEVGEEPTGKLRKLAEGLMEARMDEFADVEGEYKLEGECLSFEGGKEEVAFWVHQPWAPSS